ncbi:hypothetical protein DH2020_031122 [Rehmannia glutinosa]|uniref:Uncharacterized protein n=1 Tax=Rehmannia glutinosa TaxID=99300 RepID=A0ABR0VLV0_REHGL
MADDTRLKDLQEARKRIDQDLQTESMKREAAEMKLQEQISGINIEVQEQLSGLNERYEHLTNTLAAIQLQLLNLNKGKTHSDEESILGGPYPEEEELSYLQDHVAIEDEDNSEQVPMEEVQMSLNALTGEDGVTTMRLFGESNGHRLHILIDSENTLSFIQESTAKKLGCQLEAVKPLLVKVANGQRMVSSYPLRVLQNEG